MPYDPNLDTIHVEKQVPGTDLVVQVVSYNGGQQKVSIRRLVLPKGRTEHIAVDPKRLTFDEFRALVPVLDRLGGDFPGVSK